MYVYTEQVTWLYNKKEILYSQQVLLITRYNLPGMGV